MFKYLWNKNKTIVKLTIMLLIVTVVIGGLAIVDTIQKCVRDNKSVSYELTENDGKINAYNVEGLSEDEINKLLEEGRNKKNN